MQTRYVSWLFILRVLQFVCFRVCPGLLIMSTSLLWFRLPTNSYEQRSQLAHPYKCAPYTWLISGQVFQFVCFFVCCLLLSPLTPLLRIRPPKYANEQIFIPIHPYKCASYPWAISGQVF